MPRSDHEPADGRTGIGRRRFLAGLGVGAAGALTLNHVEALAEMVEGPVPTSTPDHRFSRMFQLPAFADPRSTAVRNAMIDIGKLPRAARVRSWPRSQHPAVVLRPARDQCARQWSAPWPGRGSDRRRDDHRNAPARQVFLPQHQLPAVPAQPSCGDVHDDRPAPVGEGGSRQPWPVAAIDHPSSANSCASGQSAGGLRRAAPPRPYCRG